MIIIFKITPGVAQDYENIKLAEEYILQGEHNKAKDLFEELSRKKGNIPHIHKNYVFLLSDQLLFKDAHKYVDKVIRQNPDNLEYYVSDAYVFLREGKEDDVKKILQKISSIVKNDVNKINIAAQQFIVYQMNEYAAEVYLKAREVMRSDKEFTLELGMLYRILNKKDDMVREYLKYASQNPNNMEYVKNVLQSSLKPEDIPDFENLLYDKIQKDPDNLIFVEFLIWANLQQKNFMGAFVQAKALNKRTKQNVFDVLEIGKIALENRDYQTAIKIFEHVVSEGSDSFSYGSARQLLIKSREELVKNTFPVNIEDIKKLIDDYQKFVDELGLNQYTAEALRSKAMLQAFYLDDRASAIDILNKLIAFARAEKSFSAQCKLDLGDIYLLSGEPWESTLLYSQVELTEKEDRIGYEAKLKNAKLSYYKGEFELAKGHLNVLKLATSREIANDALSLSLFIQDNTTLDSTDEAMKSYAEADLLLFQNRKTGALKMLDSLLVRFPNHSLSDDILWEQANICLQIGDFKKSLALLERITEKYGFDLLGDEAYFTTGKIYEEQLKDKDKAMEIYQSFLIKYPGSIYTIEARKRFRQLRGDFKKYEMDL